MEIIRDEKGFKIKIPCYKIHIQTTKNKDKTYYQYSCNIPPILCSYFKLKETTSKEDTSNMLLFYNYNGSNYIMSGDTLFQVLSAEKQHIAYNTFTQHGVTPNEELVDYCKLHPINFTVLDRVRYKDFYDTTAYKLPGKNGYRVTLPKKYFEDKIDPTRSNHITFIIDTSEDDLLALPGVVKYLVNDE